MFQDQVEQSVTEDPIEDSQDHQIPTQQSCTNKPVAKKSGAKTTSAKKTGAKRVVANKTGAQMVEEGIAAGLLKSASLKRRCKSERIAKKSKPFNFDPDGAGSSASKAWDVDDVLAEP